MTSEHPLRILVDDIRRDRYLSKAVVDTVAALLDAGKLAERVECPHCDGGETEDKVYGVFDKCFNCHGTGKVWRAIK